MKTFKTREEWLDYRGTSLGGSDMSSLLGLNPWKSPYELWLEKTGRQQQPSENNNMIAGRFLEGAISDWFEYETDHVVIKRSSGNVIYDHPEYSFLKASPDRRVYLHGSRKRVDRAVMEIKTTGMSIDPDDLPPEWFIQDTYYAGILGIKTIIILWYDRHRNNIDYKIFDFNENVYNDIITEAVHFQREYIEKDIAPPASTGADILKMFPQEEEGKTIIATDEILNIYGTAIGIKRNEKIIKKSYFDISEQIKLIMRDAEKIVTPDLQPLFTFKANKNGVRTFIIKEL